MTFDQLTRLIFRKKSLLCIGLDTDISLIPRHLVSADDPVFAFNQAIIDATLDLAIAYKLNLAFYESMGLKGWRSLERTMEHLRKYTGQVFTIADAKRGDIGNTSRMYAKAFFEWLQFDAVTVAPYMGEDSVTPFLEYDDKWVILLGVTSNPGSRDFQMLDVGGRPLYEEVIRKALQWGTREQLMFVAGATHPQLFRKLREIAPDFFFLVPGIGAQGGDLHAICENGLNQYGGIMLNSSRQIIYASGDKDFAEAARAQALNLFNCITTHLNKISP
ncbi:MAG: orotidine-5'-phosphate decarboxylase [Chitinophagales bacterium]|nr:orotidine-5'-phosphate decarboxylase [Chitinophagales bacterium]MDW8418640.1 orotidine-5'-phosphate decarboxylase [Chitinophagales bacterium]